MAAEEISMVWLEEFGLSSSVTKALSAGAAVPFVKVSWWHDQALRGGLRGTEVPSPMVSDSGRYQGEGCYGPTWFALPQGGRLYCFLRSRTTLHEAQEWLVGQYWAPTHEKVQAHNAAMAAAAAAAVEMEEMEAEVIDLTLEDDEEDSVILVSDDEEEAGGGEGSEP